MTSTLLASSHLRSVVERAIARHDPDPPVCIVVHGDPSTATELGDVAGRPTRVLGTQSPLAIRAALADLDDDVLVVVTDLDANSLGDDLLARVVNRSIYATDRWRTVSQLFGAERPSVTLARRQHLADALITHRPLDGYPKTTSKILDVETATAALLRGAIGLATAAAISDLLDAAATPELAGFLRDAHPDVVDDIHEHLEQRLGTHARAILAFARAGHGQDVVAWGLAAAAVHHPDASDADAARALLDRDANRPGLDSDDWQRFGAAAEDRYRSEYEPDRQSAWRHRAAEILADLTAGDLARHSDIIPISFDQRLAVAAGHLQQWVGDPAEQTAATATQQAIAALKRHVDRSGRSDEIDVVEMAARLIRRGEARITTTGSLAEAARAYRDDGAWVDRARIVVSRLGTDPTLVDVCRNLTQRFDTARREQATELAAVLSKSAGPLPDDLTGVEKILDSVIAPLAGKVPVLLVVLDGMALSSFTEFAGELAAGNWTTIATGSTTTSPAVAVLPTVTEVSRTSLLAGTTRRGDMDSEKRAFAEHPALLQVSGAGQPPVLFHKRDLRVGGLDAPPQAALDAIADTRQQIIGVVINNIDERLKDVVAPPAGWTLNDLAPLRSLLAEAKRAGRAVVLTADHGHIIDRDAEQRPGADGGERWRPADTDPAPDEVVVRGPRVVAESNAVILPTVEQVRYATRRNGYHGGLTVQEVLVPLVVLAAEEIEGWGPVPFAPPEWWEHRHVVAVAPSPPAKRRAVDDTPRLFDPEPETEPAATTGLARPELIAKLLTSDLYAEQLSNPRVRIDHDTVAAVLDRLGTGVPVPEEQIAALTGLAAARASRFVSQLQEILNIDGYAIVRVDAGEVRLDVDLLRTQFGL